jgi:deoxycytidylate deaminase
MILARVAATRVSCQKRQVGAILATKDGRVISTGYNGTLPGMRDCEASCLRNSSGKCIGTIHAEINALLRAKEKADLLFCTDQPCLACLKATLSHNPEIEIVYWRPASDPDRDGFVTHLGGSCKISRIDDEFEADMLRHLPLLQGEKKR